MRKSTGLPRIARPRAFARANEVATEPASFANQSDSADYHCSVDRFGHVVNRQGGGTRRHQRLHLDPGPRLSDGSGLDFELSPPASGIKIDFDLLQRDLM